MQRLLPTRSRLFVRGKSLVTESPWQCSFSDYAKLHALISVQKFANSIPNALSQSLLPHFGLACIWTANFQTCPQMHALKSGQHILNELPLKCTNVAAVQLQLQLHNCNRTTATATPLLCMCTTAQDCTTTATQQQLHTLQLQHHCEVYVGLVSKGIIGFIHFGA